jgi:microcystin-dependent protein
MDFVQTLEAWKDFPEEELSSSDIDEIKALVDNAIDQLMRPVVTIPVGATMTWHTATPPDRWILCGGQQVFKDDYPELWALWGDTFGTSTTDMFTVLNMIDRSPIGADAFIALNAVAGAFTHTLTVAEIPAHNHRMPKQSATVNAAVNVITPAARTDNPATPHALTDDTGGGGGHNNLHPVRGVKFIVYGGKAP